MLRSFQYAPYFHLHTELEHGVVREEDIPYLRKWADYWVGEVSDGFLHEYRDTTQDAEFLPRDEGQFQDLLRAFLFDKALYEVRYEMNNRPAWLDIPLSGILQLLEAT